MRRASLVLLAIATGACTVMSGVEELELREGASATAPTPDQSPTEPTEPKPPPKPPLDIPIAPVTGPAACGAEGSWSTCDPTPESTTCSEHCARLGQMCANDCCLGDTAGDFAYELGMAYTYASECSLAALPSNVSGGSCTTTIVPTAGSSFQLRCCCK